MTSHGDAAARATARHAAERAVARCRQLAEAPYSDMAGGLFRPFLGPAHLATQARVAAWMEEAGLSTRRDATGSLIGRYEAAEPGAPALVLASHLDSVRDGGAFDGMLGVLLAIESVAALHAAGQRLPFAIEVVGFGDEEGSRFPQSMLGARIFAGKAYGAVAAMTDQAGITLREAMHQAGLDIDRLPEATRARGDILAYFEAHIEQGPVLDIEGLSVAAVEAIAGIRRFHVRLHGVAGHAGTVPPSLRRDALAAGSEIVLAVEALAARQEGLLATVGRIEARPGAINVIPGEVSLTVELRSGNCACLDDGLRAIEDRIAWIATRRGIKAVLSDHQAFQPALCDPRLVALMARSMTACGLPARRLVSGAGHDAMMMCDWVPTAMLFIRSPGGVSHHPDERVDIADVRAAFAVMADFIQRLPRVLAPPRDGALS
ncbi:allantoate amidohydrolase [Gluconacetobacter sacchari DSM 12717]|uniref:Allantoate amidohydrolase n=2 Tax=Gluconacetobacter sacchari TaxID=92759 RepID=A0A7W4IFR6_9PROT|nr:allantoate amidohydrolase [Gluconacetobacter sacchari]MBB2162063.1 allantoate amidohydrolase [Gluconacetobacter sacchari]GBQ22605.1 allantoate amidohydrolase [Gluconacetobacter sacchari DSM 12717]